MSRIKSNGDPYILIKNRKELVNDMEEKYGYLFCMKCKRSRGFYKLHVHHIIWRGEAPEHESLHSKINLYICCDQCHTEYHKKKSTRNSLVIERNLVEVFKGVKIVLE